MEAQEEAQEKIPEVDGKVNGIDDLVMPGRFGVTNRQLIPVIKQLVAESSIEKLKLLRSKYLYTFENSLKYLKKAEREYIISNV
jgi:uncharacterized membrane protein